VLWKHFWRNPSTVIVILVHAFNELPWKFLSIKHVKNRGVIRITIGDQNNWIENTLATTDHEVDSWSYWLKGTLRNLCCFLCTVEASIACRLDLALYVETSEKNLWRLSFKLLHYFKDSDKTWTSYIVFTPMQIQANITRYKTIGSHYHHNCNC
jgi:hypothetical protein